MERTDYYVYILFRETGQPFYCGKGSRSRWKQHEKLCMTGRTHKDAIIRNMLAAGLDMPKVQVAQNLTNDEAYRIERIFISAIGRTPHGPLVNLTDGGDGPAFSIETKEKIR